MAKSKIAPNTKLQDRLAFSRAVIVDNFAYISGTAPFDDNLNIAFPNDTYGQTKYCLNLIKSALNKAGFELDDIVRTRLYIKDINNLNEIAKAFNEVFFTILPACSIVQVSGFIDENILIYIDADAQKPTTL